MKLKRKQSKELYHWKYGKIMETINEKLIRYILRINILKVHTFPLIWNTLLFKN